MVEELIEALKSFTPEDVEEIERADRQFKALLELYKKLKNPEEFLKLTVINALLSYQLQMKGENYWEAFAGYFFGGKGIDDFPDFLSKFNRRFLSAKLKRFSKVRRCVEELFSRFSLEELGGDLTILVDFLSKCLGQKRDAKTVVFAAKMFAYGYKVAFDRYPEGLWDIEIPLDSRLKKVLPSTEEWRMVAEEAGIPPLRLDALIWVPMGGESSIPERLKEKVERLKRALSVNPPSL
jgi:DNA-(apurinic or apyrimidinic site) lyase